MEKRFLIVCESENYSLIVGGDLFSAMSIANKNVEMDKTVDIYNGLFAQGDPKVTRINGEW